MHRPPDRIVHTTAFVIPVVEHWKEREIVHGSTMNDRSDDPSHHERTLLPWYMVLNHYYKTGTYCYYKLVGFYYKICVFFITKCVCLCVCVVITK